MGHILEVLLIVSLMFVPVCLLVEAVLFSSPKEWWRWIIGIGKYSWLVIKKLWCYLNSDRYGCIKNCLQERIDLLTEKLDCFQSHKYYESLLSRIKKLAKKYREVQDQIVHPKKSAWEVHENAYKPFYRLMVLPVLSIIFLWAAWYLFFGFELNPIKELRQDLGFSKDSKGFAEILIALVGLFPALIVWFYRDLNKYREMETAHRDVMFGEHKQLVEWATTEAKTEKKDKSEDGESADVQLTEIHPPMIQVAGIYQLAPFLKDHHANLYQRSTLETLRAIVNAGRPKWDKWVKDYEAWIIGHKIGTEPEKPVLTAAERAVHAVLRENPVLFYHNHFNAKDFNLAGFDGRELVLIGCAFQETMLAGADFSGANLISANFKNSILLKSNFSRCCLVAANFEEASLCAANFSYLKIHRFPRIDTSELLVNCLIFTYFTNANLKCSNLNRVIIKPSSFIKTSGAIVSEPNLIETEAELCRFAERAIQKGAISIADERIKTHPLFESVKGEHNLAIEALKKDGLTVTTKASLET